MSKPKYALIGGEDSSYSFRKIDGRHTSISTGIDSGSVLMRLTAIMHEDTNAVVRIPTGATVSIQDAILWMSERHTYLRPN